MVTKEVPYIARFRPEPPPPPAPGEKHFHLGFTGGDAQVITVASWRYAEDAATWAAALRSPPVADSAASDGKYYLETAGMNPNTGQARRCTEKCPGADPDAGRWWPIVGRLVSVIK